MKKTLIALLIVLNTSICYSQVFKKRQIFIPLNNIKGVPYLRDKQMDDLIIDGFEIDQKGSFYFLAGGKSVCLAAFSGNKAVFRRNYKEFSAGQLYFYHNGLYTFNKLGKNDLVVINPADGALIKVYNKVNSKHIVSYKFVDSSLIFELIGDPDLFYQEYNLTGKYLKQAPNQYNTEPFIIPIKEKDTHYEFLGKWNEKFVFWNITGDNIDKQTFWLVGKDGTILAQKTILNNDVFGDSYENNPPEHRKVRNGNLYVLGRKGNTALITEVPLASLFRK